MDSQVRNQALKRTLKRRKSLYCVSALQLTEEEKKQCLFLSQGMNTECFKSKSKAI
jgi:hypothetical protein